MSAYTKPTYGVKSDGKTGLYIGLAAGVIVVFIIVILAIKMKSPPPQEALKIAVEDYFKGLQNKEYYKAYEIESVNPNLPLAYYQAAIEKKYDLKDRNIAYKSIIVQPAVITGLDAKVAWSVDEFDEKAMRTSNIQGEFTFHKDKSGWKKDPDDSLTKALDDYKQNSTE